MLHVIDPEDMPYHEGPFWTTREYHTWHCSYAWMKMHRAVEQGRKLVSQYLRGIFPNSVDSKIAALLQKEIKKLSLLKKLLLRLLLKQPHFLYKHPRKHTNCVMSQDKYLSGYIHTEHCAGLLVNSSRPGAAELSSIITFAPGGLFYPKC
jgi:hypothetical protein